MFDIVKVFVADERRDFRNPLSFHFSIPAIKRE